MSESKKLRGGVLVAKTLAAKKIDVVFTLSGGFINPVLEGLMLHGIRVVNAPHEQIAGHLADGWARVTREPSVCLVGPEGFANAVPAMLEAYGQGSPIIFITGSSTLKRREQGGFKETDHVRIAEPLTQIQQAAGSINNNTAQTIGFTYDNANRRTVTTLANGATINYAYDSANQLTGITYKKADTTTIGDLSYTYDNVGRRITAGGSLTAINLPSTVSSTTYNANNQLTSWAGSTFSYDANGSLTSDGTNTYTWDARNQLASLSGGISASFAYDGVRRRIGKTISGTTAGFVYDGMNFVQEKNGTGSGASVTANLITGPGVDEVYTRMTGTGGSAVLSHFLPDANNNVIRLLDGTQTVTDSYSYEAYGKTTYSGSNGNSQQYTGRENDGTGLYFYRARYYLPNAERFISEDPSGLSAGPNVYTYVNGNPVGRVDPTGLQTFTIGVGGAFQQTAAGASQSYSVGYSSPNGKFCIIATTCARFGPGESAGAGITASVSKGSFCSGDTATVGVFGEGGEGVIGGGSVDVGSEDVSGSVGFKGFVGAGAAGGTQVCATHTTCF